MKWFLYQILVGFSLLPEEETISNKLTTQLMEHLALQCCEGIEQPLDLFYLCTYITDPQQRLQLCLNYMDQFFVDLLDQEEAFLERCQELAIPFSYYLERKRIHCRYTHQLNAYTQFLCQHQYYAEFDLVYIHSNSNKLGVCRGLLTFVFRNKGF